ncbi:SLIT and NTRK-like protein 6 [Larimichthys crocea]|uniref:Uncharacterized protein n=1 Tax=Larimichthys crocea TaxID=215358 RepID=A0ACD3QXZ5_LARCR|nr:SLIT and NTRK-like protein 6 [Larimichthys crocea]
MFVLMIIFCSAGLVVFVVHRRRRKAKKKAAEEQPRENTSSSPIHLHYSMYGQKTTHHTLTQRTGSSTLYEERSHSPIVQICRNPTYCSQHKEHDDLDYSLDEPWHQASPLPEYHGEGEHIAAHGQPQLKVQTHDRRVPHRVRHTRKPQLLVQEYSGEGEGAAAARNNRVP